MATSTDSDKINIVRRWFEAVNNGDLSVVEDLVAPDVVDHSDLNLGHGGGSTGHKQLVSQLRDSLPNWRSEIRDISANGNLVTIHHTGSGVYPEVFNSIMGSAPADEEMRRVNFDVVSTVRLDESGKIVEHWAEQAPIGRKSTPGPLTPEDRKRIARRWFDAVNSGDWAVLDELIADNVVDHSGLNVGHGGGAGGHKRLVSQLREQFPDWSSRIDKLAVDGDVVTIWHSGSARYPSAFNALMGSLPPQGEMRRIEFSIVSKVRIDDNGLIVEHWAEQTPLGRSGSGPSEPPDYRGGGGASDTEQNKAFLRNYVQYVIDGQNPSLARHYFADNFHNHDPAPGELPGLAGVTAFLESIFSAFSGFRTTIETQVAEDDLVAGLWKQTFKNTGDYLNFPASGKQINIGGITITRVREGKIVEEWEARDAHALLVQMGVFQPLGPLEDGETEPSSDEAEERRKEIARSYFYDVWLLGNLERADQLFSPNFVNHLPLPGQQAGMAGIKQFVRQFRSAFPDCSVSVDLQFSSEDKVVTRYSFRGTHRGSFLGIPATGRPIQLTGISIFRLDGDRITDAWDYWDTASLIFQLTPPAGPGPGGPGPGGPGPGGPWPGPGPGGPGPGGSGPGYPP